TRCYRDWSSDVCSSDLGHLQIFSTSPPSGNPGPGPAVTPTLPAPHVGPSTGQQVGFQVDSNHAGAQLDDSTVPPLTRRWSSQIEIGRASCRQGGEDGVR